MIILGKCDDCETELRPTTCRDSTGFYVGIVCTCEASNERLSDYYETYYMTERHIEDGTYKRTD